MADHRIKCASFDIGPAVMGRNVNELNLPPNGTNIALVTPAVMAVESKPSAFNDFDEISKSAA